MAYYAKKVKTPFGKTVSEKKSKTKRKTTAYKENVKPMPFKMAFLLMTLEEGQKLPTEEEQRTLVMEKVKTKDYLTNTTFVDVPVIARTIVFRIEKWLESGKLVVSRIAKSTFDKDLNKTVYICVSKPLTWNLN